MVEPMHFNGFGFNCGSKVRLETYKIQRFYYNLCIYNNEGIFVRLWSM